MPDESIDIRVRLRDARQFKADTTTTAGAITGIGKASQRSNEQIRRSSKIGSSALRNLTRSAIGLGVAYLGIGAAKSAIATTIGLAKTTVSLHRNLGLSNKVASEWAASAVARGVDTNALSLSFTNLSKNVEAARGGDKKAIATARAHSLVLDELAGKSKARIAAFRAQQVLQLAAVRGDRVATASLRARGIVQLADLKREDLLIKARQKTAAATLSALSGGKKAMATFRALGITQKDLRRGSMDFNFILGKIAEGLGRMPGGAKRAAIAQRLLGRSSQTTLPIFTQGRASMEANLKLADKYGVTLSKNPLKAVRQLAHAQKELEFAQLGWQVTFATKVAPALTKLILLITRGSQWLSKHSTAAKILGGALVTLAVSLYAVSTATKVVTAATNISKAAHWLWARDLIANNVKIRSSNKLTGGGFRGILGNVLRLRNLAKTGILITVTYEIIKHLIPGHGQMGMDFSDPTAGDAYSGRNPYPVRSAAWYQWEAGLHPKKYPVTHGVFHTPGGGTLPAKGKAFERGRKVRTGSGGGGEKSTKQVQSLGADEGGGPTFELHSHLHLDGREAARAVQQFTLGQLARA